MPGISYLFSLFISSIFLSRCQMDELGTQLYLVCTRKKAMVCNPSCILESPTELKKNTDAQSSFLNSSIRIWVRFEHKNFYKAPQVNILTYTQDKRTMSTKNGYKYVIRSNKTVWRWQLVFSWNQHLKLYHSQPTKNYEKSILFIIFYN